MIFVTVGAQMPFDRLVRTVDQWAQRHGRDDVFAQIGPTERIPKHVRWEKFLEPQEFVQKVRAASVIVAHAGMGSILTALEHSKPILVMPRLGKLMETRNDHQVATAQQFLAQGRVFVAMDETHLDEQLERIDRLRPSERISNRAAPQLLQTLRAFIDAGEIPFRPIEPAMQYDVPRPRPHIESEPAPAAAGFDHQLIG